MINIAICDDMQSWVFDIKRKCEEVLAGLGINYRFYEFSSGEEVLAYSGERIHLLFLDIEMNGISGIDVMEQIKNNPLFWRIVFVTGHEKFHCYTIDIKTLAFLNKPINRDEIKGCLRAVFREEKNNRKITIGTMDKELTFLVEEIVYIEAKGNYVTVVSNTKEAKGYVSLKKVEDMLRDTSIIRIHRSFLVNLQYVKSIIWGKVILLTDETIPLGRLYYQTSKDAYFRYIKQMAVYRLD